MKAAITGAGLSDLGRNTHRPFAKLAGDRGDIGVAGHEADLIPGCQRAFSDGPADPA